MKLPTTTTSVVPCTSWIRPTTQFPRSPSWYVFDAERRHAGPIGPLEPDAEGPGLVECAVRRWRVFQDCWHGAGRGLRATVERYNGPLDHWRRQRTSDGATMRGTATARVSFRLPISYARSPNRRSTRSRSRFGCLGTKGGLKIDHHARVLQSRRVADR